MRSILYGDKKNHYESNFKILGATIKFRKSTQRLKQPFLSHCLFSLYVQVNVTIFLVLTLLFSKEQEEAISVWSYFFGNSFIYLLFAGMSNVQ